MKTFMKRLYNCDVIWVNIPAIKDMFVKKKYGSNFKNLLMLCTN